MNPFWTLRHFVGAKLRWATLQGEALSCYQDGRAHETVRWVNEHSRFYRSHWQGYDLSDWHHLPTVDKQLMNAHFDTFNTVGIGKELAMQTALRSEQERDFAPTIGGNTVGLSSGTSGQRGLFVLSPYEQAAWAGTILARALHRLSPRGERVAFFLRANSNLYESVGRGRLIRFRYFDLMSPLEETIAALNQFQPTILSGPPSVLEQLAQARAKGQLRIAVHQIISAAEMLEPQDKVFLESSFQVSLHQVYQATEGLIGISCTQGSLHLQEDLVAVQLEPLDQDRYTPILTDLWRRTQPIIRYRLGDVWRLGVGCGCGSGWRTIRVEGRMGDVLKFETGKGLYRLYPDDVRQIILGVDAVRDYAVVQEQIGHLLVFLEADKPEATETARSVLHNILAGWGCRVERLEVVPGLPERPANLKRRRVRVV
jgi:phenylacetate-CoA ligase